MRGGENIFLMIKSPLQELQQQLANINPPF